MISFLHLEQLHYYLRPNDVRTSIEDNSKAQQVDASGPGPLHACYESCGRTSKHINKSKDGEQQG